MALVLLNATPWVSGYDFTADSNKITLTASIASLDTTTFATTGWRSHTGGLLDFTGHLEGLWSGPVDGEAFPALGVPDQAATVSATGLAGAVAYMGQAAKMRYHAFDAAMGALAPFALDLSGSNKAGLVRGQVAAGKQSVAATGALTPTTGVQLGAVGASQYAYGSFHAFSPVGTTITAVLESAAANTFSGATTRATVGPVTTVGGMWAVRAAGAITDTWWRWRISAITGSFTVAAAIGIQ